MTRDLKVDTLLSSLVSLLLDGLLIPESIELLRDDTSDDVCDAVGVACVEPRPRRNM